MILSRGRTDQFMLEVRSSSLFESYRAIVLKLDTSFVKIAITDLGMSPYVAMYSYELFIISEKSFNHGISFMIGYFKMHTY